MEGKKRFNCPKCKSAFYNVKMFNHHFCDDHGKVTFRCECGYKTDTSPRMNSHLQNHARGVLLKCEFCSFKCIKVERLTTHQARHREVRKYSCDYCHIAFNLIHEFQRHSLKKSHILNIVLSLENDYSTSSN